MYLSEKNFVNRAMHCYDNPQCIALSEFEDDLARFSRVKKLITNYQRDRELNERLIINHLVILYNVFGNETTEFLLFKLEQSYHKVLFPFLVLLNRMNDDVLKKYPTDFDQYVVEKLRQL